MSPKSIILYSEPRKISYKPPCRYPGGKHYAKRFILPHIEFYPEMVSPFIGGGSIELSLTKRGTKIYGYDMFLPLVDFWKHNIKDSISLYLSAKHIIEKNYDNMEYFRMLRDNIHRIEQSKERAIAFFVLSNTLHAGGSLRSGVRKMRFDSKTNRVMCGPRKNKSFVPPKKTSIFFNPLITVEHLDFRESLEKHRNMPAYLDPPYPNASPLYGDNRLYHEEFPHELLAKILYERRTPWYLSYSDCEDVRYLYPISKFNHIRISLSYRKRRNVLADELLIIPRH